MLSRRHALAALLSAAAAAASGLPRAARAAAGPPTVVATTGMIADAARNVAGDAATVEALMGAGIDPHAYRQTRDDVAALVRADLVLWNGLFLEAQLEDFLLELARRKPVVAAAEALPEDRLIAHEDYAGRFDPHVWMDPELWSLVVARIEAALAEAAPGAAPVFAANAAAYRAEISALADYARATLRSIPAERRVLISAHDAFGYLGAAYGFEVLGIQGLSTESEAGVARIEALVDLIVARRVGAVFVESSVSDRNMRALIEGAAARGHPVSVGGELFSDAMGPEGTYEGTYLGMIDHNVTTLARALGGNAPAGGRLGRLSAGL
ncbi:MAG: zinc ABC transporter substrate-binding protein [Pseudomonadota bacterium]